MVDLGIISLALRAVEALWALLVTALIATLIDAARGIDSAAVVTTLNFAIFVAVLSWIAIFYALAARLVTAIHHPLTVLLLDGFTTLFSFISGVTLASRMGVRDCGQLSALEGLCRMGQASTAFMWFLFACFAVTTFLASKEYRGSSVRSGPSMSQVHV